MLPLHAHDTALHHDPGKAAARTADFVTGRDIFVADVDDYERDRTLLYALGAKSVANKMMASVDTIVHGGRTAPAKARAKYPAGTFVRAQSVLPLFHREIRSFAEFLRALQAHGFTLRNPSDEGDPELDIFDLPRVDGSLHATLLHYLATSPFIRGFVRRQSFAVDTREPDYIDFPVPGADVTWYYAWNRDAWSRVSAQRGDGDYPLEIKGPQLLRIAPVLWKQSTGLLFHEYPHAESIRGLFVQAGVDVRTGRVHGAAISRVWT